MYLTKCPWDLSVVSILCSTQKIGKKSLNDCILSTMTWNTVAMVSVVLSSNINSLSYENS